jgi:erythronate-4-phosphate dehydrogenase
MKIVADCNIPFVAECFSSLGDVLLSGGRDMDAAMVADADILLVRSITKVGAELLEGSSVRFVGTATIGKDHIDEEYLREKGIGFASAPGSNANSVAEYIVAALLALGKKHKFELDGKSIGIVGVGNVGSRVEKKAMALGMDVVLNDPPLARETEDAKYRSIEEVYGCDFVTVHTPLTFEGEDKTYHLVDGDFLGALKKECYFLNSSRGGVVDTDALKKAIAEKTIAGAVLDVWENEPDIDGELLLKVELSTPHIAGYSFDGKVAGMGMIYEAACDCFGVEAKHSASDFLPAPEVARIDLDEFSGSEESIIGNVVQQVYVINRDDFNTREILLIEENGRGKWFDDLRKNYAVRREFQNTEVLVKDTESSTAKKLAGIGFKVIRK